MTIAPAHTGFGYCGLARFGDFLDACHSSSRAHIGKDAGHEKGQAEEQGESAICVNPANPPFQQREHQKDGPGSGHHMMRSQKFARLTWMRSAI